MQKLILGTAQFGSDYGIKHDGQPSTKEIEKIAQVAWNGGIRVIHSSWEYHLPDVCDEIFKEFEWIRKHKDYPNLFRYGNKTGFSLYDPEDMISLNGSLIQVPINILDKRFLNLIKDGITIHARSVFLQGLLLMDPDLMPRWISDFVKTKIAMFHAQCRWSKLLPYEAALGWVLGLEDIDHVIVGVNSVEQLKQLLRMKSLQWDYDFSIQDENVLDPRRWPKA